MTMLPIIGLSLLVGLGAAASDLDAIKAEPNLEKRSDRALQYAGSQFEAAAAAYSAGDFKNSMAALDEVLAAVELSHASLQETGKSPRRSPKHFKRAEVRTRELGRKLRDFSESVSYEDRAAVEKVRKRVQEIHDELLEGIMSKGKKRK